MKSCEIFVFKTYMKHVKIKRKIFIFEEKTIHPTYMCFRHILDA
jgi:hypothetical protein